MKNNKENEEMPLVFSKMKANSVLARKSTRFNKLKIIPLMNLKEKTFYKRISQF